MASVQINQLEVQGFNSSRGVSKFLGIPFATIPARFRQAVSVDPRKESGIFDATSYGPHCPQPVDGGRQLLSHLYAGREDPAPTAASEFSCLTLNIYTPLEVIISSSVKLPVLLWIHGGGWTVGDGNYDHDGTSLVEKSIDSGKPFVYVSLNYRVGYFGFLTSKELRDEAKRLGEAGYANQGLYDQRLALKWVHSNIGYFGGDPSRLTLAGQSAGAWSVLAHLKSEESPIFQQALVMSCPSLPLSSLEESQDIFDRLVASNGVSASAPATEKLAAIRKYAADELQALTQCRFGQFAMPILDPEWFVDTTLPFEQIEHLPPWIKAIVIGSTKQEYALYGIFCASWTSFQFQKAVQTVIPDEDFAKEVMEVYHISEDADHATAFNGFLQFGTDSLFSTVPVLIGDRDSPEVSLYSFDQEDDFDSSLLKGYAYHALDNAYFCRLTAVAGLEAPSWRHATANAFSEACFDIIYGKPPWEAYHKTGQVMSFQGKKTGLAKLSGLERWARFIATKERQRAFREAGERLLIYTLKYIQDHPPA
ncbi:hypothetical protein FE257_012667 [Aspergillus nanangensis]|uniref:Carboxylic ester hydrolase n=1 Tax=Aspergillus nanangensis TaxID=2582783 RepID=A0AAD4GQN6_ASPNN|nr:hypothetical protein FE257_012667 [Aspergillus nanangensis]